MKRAVTLLLSGMSLAGPVTLSAQDPPERQESAVGNELDDFGGLIGLEFRFGDMMNEYAALAGIRGAVVLKRRVYLGLGGVGLVTDNALVGVAPAPLQPLRMGYGGLLIGYMIPTRSMVQFSVDLLLAGGGVSVEEGDDTDGIFVYEPTAAVELKLARMVRLRAGAGYRFVGDVDLAGIGDSDLRGPVGTFAIQLEWF